MYEINVLLQGAECAALTGFMKLISDIITPVPLCIIAVIVFWSVNKRSGILLALTIIFNVTVNSALKLFFRVKRPFDVRSDIKKLDTTEGYSFPSGHSGQASGIAYRAVKEGKSFALISGILATALMMVSRMYLGMHSVIDVIAGAALGVLCAAFAEAVYKKAEKTGKFWILYVIAAISAVFTLVYGLDEELLIMTAISAGAVTGFIVEERFIGYKVPETLTKKISASVIGLVVIFAVMAFFKLFNTESMAVEFIRYTLFGFSITAAAPYLINKILLRRKQG